MRKLPYRLLCTATAAPNDYIELGTSSEALGELGNMDMLTRFFRNQNNNSVDTRGHWRGFYAPRDFEGKQWRFKRHAKEAFWRWVCSWGRSLRKPSDLGFENGKFVLPPLRISEHVVKAKTRREGWLFDVPAIGMAEEREERRRTIQERCEKVAELASHSRQVLIWCHLNKESETLAKMIPDAVEISGADSDEEKETKMVAFVSGQTRGMITKHKIGAWGLNLQNCSHIISFVSHSFEQHYQGIRRCWRFGQKNPVQVDLVCTEGEKEVLENLKRKEKMAEAMFVSLVRHMNEAMSIGRSISPSPSIEVPKWIKS